jgi:dolichyl-phosphate-mannose--protein O-mannosyl transferase
MDVLLAVLLFFPPTAVVFIACVIKLWALLAEKTMTWRRAFGVAAVVSIVATAGYMFYLKSAP